VQNKVTCPCSTVPAAAWLRSIELDVSAILWSKWLMKDFLLSMTDVVVMFACWSVVRLALE